VVISSRTPEGGPNRCPICGKFVRIDLSRPTNYAPCPNCGHLLFFVVDSDDPSIAYVYPESFVAANIPVSVIISVPLSVCLENSLVPIDEIEGKLVVASENPLSYETLEKLQFGVNRMVKNVLVSSNAFSSLFKRYEEQSVLD